MNRRTEQFTLALTLAAGTRLGRGLTLEIPVDWDSSDSSDGTLETRKESDFPTEPIGRIALCRADKNSKEFEEN